MVTEMVFRELRTNEYELLKDFLYEAIFIPEGMDPPDRSIIEEPELAVYYEGFGSGPADHCIIADDNGVVVGAVWSRIMDDYGHIDDNTPSLAMAVYENYRGQGIGTQLLRRMLLLLTGHGYTKVSLSVQKENRAVQMYRRAGFTTMLESDEEYLMVCKLSDTSKKIGGIRTGGQSGVDRAAMDFAREWGIPLCGWCPRGGWAEDYPDPPGLLLDYQELTETPSEDTAQRTKWNVRDCDAILTIIPESAGHSPGTEIGLEEGKRLGKPMFTAARMEDVSEIIRWINNLPEGTELCVGGPRASECAEAYDTAKIILRSIAETIL